MCQYIHQGTKIDFRLKKKTRREEADRLPAFHLEGSRARTRKASLSLTCKASLENSKGQM